ncbi:MAG: rRNA maturation RNase YbeY [Ectothiorhodospiraceae bacterium]|nr:rRNA maturation RNase YbeY [Ectothiorhodospiraceae bacterium]
MIEVQVHFQAPAGPISRTFIQSAISYVLRKEKVAVATISCILIDDMHMQALNKQYLNHNYATDVLSFPLSEEGDPLEGEIYISVETARLQAKTYQVPVKEELTRLIVHGTLHLCGYDDSEQQSADKMRSMQEWYVRDILNEK